MNRGFSSKKRRRKAGGRALLLVLLALFVLAGAVLALVFGLRGCRRAASKRTLPFGADANFCYTGDGFLYLSGNVLNYLNLEEEGKNRSFPLDSTEFKLAGTEQLKVVYSASSLQVVETPFDNVFDGIVKKVDCGNKYVGAFIENEDGTHSLRVFNSAGSQCYRKDFTDRVLLDFGFEGGDSSVLWISELVTTGSAITTTITTYDLNRESTTGVISVQGQVAKKVFVTKKSIFAFCTDSVVRFDRSTNDEAYRIQCRGYECLSASASGGRMYMLLTRSGAEGIPLDVLSMREDTTADENVIAITDIADTVGCFAFILSQDQTLRCKNISAPQIKGTALPSLNGSGHPRTVTSTDRAPLTSYLRT